MLQLLLDKSIRWLCLYIIKTHCMSYLFVFKRSLLGVKICLSHAQIGLLWGSQKSWATPRWSPLGVKFKIFDEYPRLFHMGVPPPPPRAQSIDFILVITTWSRNKETSHAFHPHWLSHSNPTNISPTPGWTNRLTVDVRFLTWYCISLGSSYLYITPTIWKRENENR